MLTPLQEQAARIIAGLAEAEGFALAGGAALIARGDVQRQTRDLDFFGLTPADVDRLLPAVDRALREAGLVVHRIQQSSGFARLIVDTADESTELDLLGADARLFPEPRYGLERLFALAAEKDHGFTREMFAEMAGRFSRLRPDEFDLDPERYERLERKVLEWQEPARNG